MTQLAFITEGRSEYDDRLWRLVGESGADPQEFLGLDYLGLLPWFVIAGASVRTQAHTHGSDVHVESIVVELNTAVSVDTFLQTLRKLLADGGNPRP